MARVRATTPHFGGYPHREHRSKKGRRKGSADGATSQWFKERMQRIRDEEEIHDIKNFINEYEQ